MALKTIKDQEIPKTCKKFKFDTKHHTLLTVTKFLILI